MSDLNDKVVSTKNALMNALGENSSKYLANMKLWFRHKWSKEEFDFEARKFLSAEKVHLHNQFLIAILNKIDAFQMPQPAAANSVSAVTSSGGGGGSAVGASNSRNRKRKRGSRAHPERSVVEFFNVLDFLQEDNLECIRPSSASETANTQMPLPTLRYCVQELFLPDAGFVLGRFLIGAWETGLVSVDDNVADYVALAVQVLLKNIISAIIMKKKHYKVTGDGSFYYDVGAPLKDPTLRNTVTRQKIDDSPLELDKELTSPNINRRSNEDVIFLSACEQVETQKRMLITLKDTQLALTDRNLIPSHSVYSLNMERLIQMMH